MILLIDNYDSFTHNLYQYLSELTSEEVRVVRNDRISVEEIARLAPSRIIISPGPGGPGDAGVSLQVVRQFMGKVPILGVCLGHQVIGEALGGRIVQAQRIVHGKAEGIKLDGRGLFRSIDSPANFTRYHSLVIDPPSLPAELEVTAWSQDGEIMGVRHREVLLEGVQFHPESIASESGKKLLANFLHYRREPFVVKEALAGLIGGVAMSQAEAEEFMEELTEGNLSPAQIAAFLTAVAVRGPVAAEIAGCARVLQRKRTVLAAVGPLLDTCGTGGDGKGTFNISSFTALAAAACGARVAKHGNRAVSSISGSADFYRELGVPVDITPVRAAELIEQHGFAFLFAPTYHGAMRHAAVPRREMGVKTIMNLVGPLVNPAGAEYQLIGVYDPGLCRTVAEAAWLLGVKRAMVVHGLDGIDELSPAAPSRVVELSPDGSLKEYEIDPATLGIRGHTVDGLAGGDAVHNAALARELAAGGGPAALRDAVALNTAAALTVYGTVGEIAEGLELVYRALDEGLVAAKIAALSAPEPAAAAPSEATPAAPAATAAPAAGTGGAA